MIKGGHDMEERSNCAKRIGRLNDNGNCKFIFLFFLLSFAFRDAYRCWKARAESGEQPYIAELFADLQQSLSRKQGKPLKRIILRIKCIPIAYIN